MEIFKRDLFDARFQILSQGFASDETQAISNENSEEDSDRTIQTALQFLDAPSDLVAGVYEGGLKTWECCFDLVDSLDSYLLSEESASRILGKKVIEASISSRSWFGGKLN